MVLNGASSQPLPVLSGVPQGSLLGPLLFLLYINNICDAGISNESKLVLYVDDILLYRAVNSPDDYALLQHDVNTLGHGVPPNYPSLIHQNVRLYVHLSQKIKED